MAVFVLDKRKKPLMPCSEKRAHLLLKRGRARVHKMAPFTIRLVDRYVETSVLQPLRVKLDPGSKHTGIALVRESEETDQETGEIKKAAHVRFLAELLHRGQLIRDAMTQRRMFRSHRRSQLRHRPARFDNRTRDNGWLPPSLQHRVDTILSWISRLTRFAPVRALSQELVKFDMQKIQTPGINGVEYQQGELVGYEVREYLLEKWNRTCAYCGAKNVRLQIEHIIPKARGGSNRIGNLTLACGPCNQSKGAKPIDEFLANDPKRLAKIKAHAKAPLHDAAAVNTTRNALLKALNATGLPVETGTGGKTKWNRIRLGIPKDHALDAACVGDVGVVYNWEQPILYIKATGRGVYQRTILDRFGFPRGYLMKHKQVYGFQTGDLVKAVVPKGKYTGTHVGRVVIRASGRFNIKTSNAVVQGISHKCCKQVQRADGYGYSWAKILILKGY